VQCGTFRWDAPPAHGFACVPEGDVNSVESFEMLERSSRPFPDACSRMHGTDVRCESCRPAGV